MILPQNAVTHELNEGQFFVMAVPVETPDPDFPHAAPQAGERGVTRICITFSVTEWKT